MNIWECEGLLPGGKRCIAKAYGVDAASGLRAIGWFFRAGDDFQPQPLIYCPACVETALKRYFGGAR